MSISLMMCFARSGGTIFNRALGCMNHIIMLSEVSHFGGGKNKTDQNNTSTVYEQAKNWYNIQLRHKDYEPALLELINYCQVYNLNLVIREWSFVNFYPFPYNNNEPVQSLKTYNFLKKQNIDFQPFAFVRDSIDVWLSSGMPDPEYFFSYYLPYAKAIYNHNIPVFKYEDFCWSPESFLQEICAFLNIPYDPNWKDKYPFFKKVNGDTQHEGTNKSRGWKMNKIKPLPRKIPETYKILTINNNKKMRQANQLLGYSPEFFKSKTEWVHHFLRKIPNFSIAKFKLILNKL